MTDESQIAPYGTWKSPITPESLTGSVTRISSVLVDDVTKELYYLESRPSEGGRQVIVKLKDNKDLFGKGWNARTNVHEYGGSCATIHDGVAYFSHVKDNRVYKVKEGEDPVPVTPDNDKWRYADLAVIPQYSYILLAVLEDHTKPEPSNVVNKLVAINTQDQSIQVVVEGADFYDFPKPSPDGTKLAWTQWFHPDMSWQGSELTLVDLSVTENSIIKVTNIRVIAGERKKISTQQPFWASNDRLLFLSDVSGYMNPWTYTLSTGIAKINTPNAVSEDFGEPVWTLGNSDYAALTTSLVVHTSIKDGRSVFSAWDLDKEIYAHLSTPYSYIESVKALSTTEIVFIGNKDDDSPAIVKLSISGVGHEPKYDVLKSTWDGKFPREIISKPQPYTFPVPPSNEPIHALYYPPHNPTYKAPEGQLPPALIILHGGPTGRFYPVLKWTVQFWTSRGWAVIDVVYGGSSGDRLEGQWGIVDVNNTISAIQEFTKRGIVDPKRIAMRGESSSGLTNMGALIKEANLVGAATSTYGVSDLLKLEEFTHKFESHYLDYLLGGPSSNVMDVYVQRSPITHADKIKTPLLIMQGLDDAVVPPEQSETIVKKIKEVGGKTKYITFEGEGHGWRKAETIREALEAELSWSVEKIIFATATEAKSRTKIPKHYNDLVEYNFLSWNPITRSKREEYGKIIVLGTDARHDIASKDKPFLLIRPTGDQSIMSSRPQPEVREAILRNLVRLIPLEERLVVHAQIQSIPSEYIVNGNADPTQPLMLTFELNSNNMSGLEAGLYAVSDPLSPRYGQHLNKSEVDSFVRPSSEATSMINSWLSSQGVQTEPTSSAGHLLTVQIPVEKANKIFNTSFISITHAASNQSVIRAMKYSLPAGLSDHMHSVRPILPPSSVSSRRKRTAPPETSPSRRDAIQVNDSGQGCDQGITLGCIQKTYNIPNDVAAQVPVGKVAMLSFEGEIPFAPDIAKSLKIVRPGINLAPIQIEMIMINGPNEVSDVNLTSDHGPGATLNIVTFLGINPHPAIEVHITPQDEDGAECAEAMLNIFNSILSNDDVPAVITTSYFCYEDNTDVTFVKTAKSLCDAITQLGTRGVTVLALSGDAGAFEGRGPTSPSTCPHATSVGTTTSSGAEVAYTFSGGGFSTIFPRPSYQDNAVKSYLDKIGSTNEGKFNSSNRGFPDVAAYGLNLWGVEDGEGSFQGLLLPAPQIWGAIITYLNTQRQTRGKSALGFINLLIYANPNAFNDIAQGDSNGYPVLSGWDAVNNLNL
ncbi:hypothetical protein Clacol_000021 [Clathrus columnatus]|uniref:Peptidase S53 domain-containing protein n=1 Tax=Clathrus columnatus TaxID=1419009 RepID=A0AAV4ZW59_9AGAM|nr:hypothetical protein Clacol_000021 [Clathrus columnatus]